MIRRSPTSTRRSNSTPGMPRRTTPRRPLPTTTAASPGTPSRRTPRRSPTTTRRSASTPRRPLPTTTAASPGTPSRRTPRRSPTTTRRSASTPRYTTAYGNRGLAWAAQKEYDKAIADFDKAIELDPRYATTYHPQEASAYHDRGLAWYAQQAYAKAIADYDEAIALDPQKASAYHDRGLAWYAQQAYAKAIADYDEAIRLDPRYTTAYGNRGDAWYAQQAYAEAIADFDKAIALDPKDACAYLNRGAAWYAQKAYAKALADYDEAIRLDPKDARAYLNRGDAWYAQQAYAKAIADYDEAIARAPMTACCTATGAAPTTGRATSARPSQITPRRVEFDSQNIGALAGRAAAYTHRFDWAHVNSDFNRLRTLAPDHVAVRAIGRKAVVQLANRTNSKTVYFLRWRIWDGTWAEWKRGEIEADVTDSPLYCSGATAAQIQFDQVLGDGKFDEHTEDLQVLQADNSADIDTLTPPLHLFYLEEGKQKLGLADRAAEAAAQQFKAVVTLYNPSSFQLGTIHYLLRWKCADGLSWTDWKNFDLESGYTYWHSWVGGRACQIKHDWVLNDGQYTPKTYDLEFNIIPSNREVSISDGKPFYFQSKDANHLELYAGY